jgi:hypothetical protein
MKRWHDCATNHISLGSLAHIALRPWLAIRLPKYFRQLVAYRTMERDRFGRVEALRFYPCLADMRHTQPVGFYFYQDCWAAKQVFRDKPAFVVDVGSTVLLAGILSQFVPCISVDLRPIVANLDGLTTLPGNVLDLPFADNEVPCLTTMCVLEHIGLGRYGDPLNPNGTSDAATEIARVIAPGGIVVYSVPVGREVLEFNGHRRFRYEQARSLFRNWHLVDACILTPAPAAVGSEEMLMSLKDPVACFCLRKPTMRKPTSVTMP